ncbi:unnamed protein product [Orchesella dallaii]|uniref:CCHC-type domain-containing protein n=1 Tax=Orchesella dallaii TaxID=48710 RepID=A0ABP1S0N5_9HEXA
MSGENGNKYPCNRRRQNLSPEFKLDQVLPDTRKRGTRQESECTPVCSTPNISETKQNTFPSYSPVRQIPNLIDFEESFRIRRASLPRNAAAGAEALQNLLVPNLELELDDNSILVTDDFKPKIKSTVKRLKSFFSFSTSATNADKTPNPELEQQTEVSHNKNLQGAGIKGIRRLDSAKVEQAESNSCSEGELFLEASSGDSEIISRNIGREIFKSNRTEKSRSIIDEWLNQTKESLKDISTIQFDKHHEPLNDNSTPVEEENSSSNLSELDTNAYANLIESDPINLNWDAVDSVRRNIKAERLAKRAIAEINEFWENSDFSFIEIFTSLELNREDSDMDSLMPKYTEKKLTTSAVKLFFNSFNKWANMKGLTEAQKKCTLPLAFTEREATMWFQVMEDSLSNAGLTTEEIQDAFLEDAPMHDDMPSNAYEVLSIKPESGETASSYLLRIKHLLKENFQKLTEEIVVDMLMNNLPRHISDWIDLRGRPITYERLKKSVKEFEKRNDSTAGPSTSRSRSHYPSIKAEQSINITQATEKDVQNDVISILSRKLAEMRSENEQIVQNLKKEIRTEVLNIQGQGQKSAEIRQRPDHARKDQVITCRYCKKPDHHVSECPKLKGRYNSQGRGNYGRVFNNSQMQHQHWPQQMWQQAMQPQQQQRYQQAPNFQPQNAEQQHASWNQVPVLQYQNQPMITFPTENQNINRKN